MAKRDALLLAAVRMFNERGFSATSLDDVAASVGVTKPLIYHYLGNKDQVLLECVRRGTELLQKAADDARTLPGTGMDRLRAFLVSYCEINMEDFGRSAICTGEELLAPDSARKFRALKANVDRSMQALIEDGIADGSVAIADSVRFTAFVLAGALNWPARWYRRDGELSAREVSERLVAILIEGLTPGGR